MRRSKRRRLDCGRSRRPCKAAGFWRYYARVIRPGNCCLAKTARATTSPWETRAESLFCSPWASLESWSRKSLDVSIWDRRTKSNGGRSPRTLRNFIAETYLLLVDLSRELHVRYLRVQWRMGRWGESEPQPVAGFYVAAEELKYQTVAPRDCQIRWI